MTQDVRVSREGGVLRVVIARPAKKNALTGAMYDAMTEALREAAEGDAGAVLLTGSDGVFTAGNDIGDFLSGAARGNGAPGLRFISALAMFDKPVVAAVDGLAIGIGTTLLLHCDLIYASPAARLKIPFVDLGVTPEGASSILLPRRCGMARASELLLLGAEIGAERAREFGLVNEVLPAERLEAHALRQAAALAAKPPGALAATRRMLRGDRQEIAAAIEKEGREFAARLGMPEARSAFFAFMGKGRAPAAAAGS